MSRPRWPSLPACAPARTLPLVSALAGRRHGAGAARLSRGTQVRPPTAPASVAPTSAFLQRDASDIPASSAKLEPPLPRSPASGVAGELGCSLRSMANTSSWRRHGRQQLLLAGHADHRGPLPGKGERCTALIGESVAKALGKHRRGTHYLRPEGEDRRHPVTMRPSIAASSCSGCGPAGDVVSRRPGHRLHIMLEPGSALTIAQSKEDRRWAPQRPDRPALVGSQPRSALKAVSRAIPLIALVTAGLSVLNVLFDGVQGADARTAS